MAATQESVQQPAAGVSFKEASDIYQKQSEGLHKLWAYFQVVSVAVIGYVVTSDKVDWTDGTYVLIAASYLLFALCNQWVLVASQRELEQCGKAVAVLAQRAGPVAEQLVVKPVRAARVRAFHLASIALVVAAIHFSWHTNCGGAKTCPASKPTSANPAP